MDCENSINRFLGKICAHLTLIRKWVWLFKLYFRYHPLLYVWEWKWEFSVLVNIKTKARNRFDCEADLRCVWSSTKPRIKVLVFEKTLTSRAVAAAPQTVGGELLKGAHITLLACCVKHLTSLQVLICPFSIKSVLNISVFLCENRENPLAAGGSAPRPP